MTPAELCTAFGVGQSTASAKAHVIANTLGVNRLEPELDATEPVETHPPGVDGRRQRRAGRPAHMPREVQEIAFEKGMIPYIPADRE